MEATTERAIDLQSALIDFADRLAWAKTITDANIAAGILFNTLTGVDED